MRIKILHKKPVAVFLFSFLFISFFVKGQNVNDNLQVNTYCTTSYSSQGCATFKNTCLSNSGWTSSNGTPQLIFFEAAKNPGGLPQDYMQLIGVGTSSEGAYYPYTFTAGYWYTITMVLSSFGGPGYFSFYAATGLGQHISTGGCQESPTIQTTSTKQIIGTITGPGDNYQTTYYMTFHANATYKQFWMYVTGTGSSNFNGTVTNVQVTTLWNTSCLPPSFVNATAAGTGQSVVAWGSVTGATSYNIRFDNESQANDGAAFYNYIPSTAPENGIHFSGIPTGPITVAVQATCAAGQLSSWTSAPSNVQVNSTKVLFQGSSTAESLDNADSLLFEATLFKVYPSPASSQVSISYNANNEGRGNLTILNQLGEKVLIKNVTVGIGHNTYLFDVSHLPTGVYIVRMDDGTNVHNTKLLIAK